MTLRPSQPRKRRRWLALATIVAVLTGLGANAALAVHDDGLFELDVTGNPLVGDANTVDGAGPGDDWATLFAGGGSAFADTFIPDPVSGAENSFFTGGGSKDERDIPAWKYKTTNDVVPDKDDIADAFAAAYTDANDPADPDDDATIIYFGMDRFDNNGDAETGFWFFQDLVSLGANGAFTGVHTVGDVLVLANWGGSNPVGEITVYSWVGGQNPLQLEFDSLTAECSVAGANDNVCAVVNRTTDNPPWPFLDKGGSQDIRPLELFEAGIDLNALFGEDICFASFLASTRSSHSTTAQLKDFSLGTFEQCGAELRTQVSDTELILGESVTDDAIITVSGTASPPAPTGEVTFTVNGDPHDVVDLSTATKSGNEYTVTSAAFTATEPGDYCFSASWPGDSNYTGGPFVDDGENECFTVIELQPEIDTEQSFFPNDDATITVPAGGGDLDGSVDFQLFDNADCDGSPLFESLDHAVGGGLSDTVETDNQTFAVSADANLWWLVTYTSNKAVHNDAISDCVENSSLTIDNG
jgi:hypothetical protein